MRGIVNRSFHSFNTPENIRKDREWGDFWKKLSGIRAPKSQALTAPDGSLGNRRSETLSFGANEWPQTQP